MREFMREFKGYVFRLSPTKDQEILINKTIGCSRFIYNHFLADKIEEYIETGKSKSAYDQMKTIPELAKENPWLKEVDSCALRNSVKNLDIKIYFIITVAFQDLKLKVFMIVIKLIILKVPIMAKLMKVLN